MKNDDRFALVVCAVALVAMVVTGVAVTREFIACRKQGGALVQAVGWPPVACITTAARAR